MSSHRNRKIIKAFSLTAPVLAALLLSGCAAGMREEVDALRQEVDQLQLRQAESSTVVDEIQISLSKLNGRLEELDYKAQGEVKRMARTIQRFSSRVPPPPGVPADLLAKDEEKISKHNGDSAKLFVKGLRELRTGDIPGSVSSFKTFLAKNPNTRFSDNALFWQGVGHEKMGEYDLAIVAYSEVFSQYPAEDLVPASLYRLGLVFEKLDTAESREDAIATLEKLIEDFPNSQYVAEVKTKLRSLKKRRSR